MNSCERWQAHSAPPSPSPQRRKLENCRRLELRGSWTTETALQRPTRPAGARTFGRHPHGEFLRLGGRIAQYADWISSTESNLSHTHIMHLSNESLSSVSIYNLYNLFSLIHTHKHASLPLYLYIFVYIYTHSLYLYIYTHTHTHTYISSPYTHLSPLSLSLSLPPSLSLSLPPSLPPSVCVCVCVYTLYLLSP